MKRWILCLSITVLFAGLTCPMAVAQGAKAAAPVAKAAAPADPAADTCGTCHADVVKNFADNPHQRISSMHTGMETTCENCHGNGQAHMEGGGDTSKITNPKKIDAKKVDALCATCHDGTHPNFPNSPHGKANVSCISCHSVHEAKSEGLLKAPEPKLCYTCHTDTKANFAQTFHHRVDEGLIKCSDCHDPHGTTGEKNLKTVADQNAVCLKCHTENAGPWAYEHPPVKAEGCLACHTPHGSPNARLLNTAKINDLCLQCHSFTNSSAFPQAKSPVGPSHAQNANYVSCTTCHTQIHGSNASFVFFK